MIIRLFLCSVFTLICITSCQESQHSLEKAQSCYDVGNYTEAISLLEELRHSSSSEIKSRSKVLLAKSYFISGNHKNVIEVIKSMDVLDIDIEIFTLLANAQEELGRYEDAINSFQYILAYDNNNYEALNNLGLCYKALGQFEKALEYYNASLEVMPDYCLAWNNKGVLHETFKRYEAAINCYNEAINNCDSVGEFFFNRGVSYLYLENNLLALGDFKKALKFTKESSPELYNLNLAFAYYKLDSLDYACEIISSISNEEARAYYKELCLNRKNKIDN